MLKGMTLAVSAGLLVCSAAASMAQTPVPVSVGAGVRTSFVRTDPDVGPNLDTFALDSVRLYVSGAVTPKIKVMFNTEYDGPGNHVDVLDAAGQFELSPHVNFWAGRFLPPSDRANLYGPYYANHWAVYTDGVQDGYPFVFQGRDNGVLYWGQFGKVKLSGGVFDGASADGNTTVISAGRAQVDFWDKEDGYYLNGTYYGKKNLLALGIAGQNQGSNKNAWSLDFLLERKVPGDGAFTIESEYADYNGLGGYNPRYQRDQGAYVLGSFLFPSTMGVMGNFELLGKYAYAKFSQGLTPLDRDYNQKTTEVDFNYVIKEFNARIMLFYKDTRFNAVQISNWQIGVGLQLQI
ncbi:MAG TPA: hypothetical protein VFP91_08995 [Vicinamibacterales bacterium]|nr:hypothetical protein [Vicinamibacterales bacterium]